MRKTEQGTGSTQTEYLGDNNNNNPVFISSEDGFHYVGGGLGLIGKAVRDSKISIAVSAASGTTTQVLTVADGALFRTKERLELLTSADAHKGAVFIKEINGNDLTVVGISDIYVVAGDKLVVPEDAFLTGAIKLDSRAYPIFLYLGSSKIVFETGLLGKR